MEFIQGQVFNINKFWGHIKKSKEKKRQQKIAEIMYEDFSNSSYEREFLQNRIEHCSCHDLLEADIYRLKASEILQNYHVKTARKHLDSQQGGQP